MNIELFEVMIWVFFNSNIFTRLSIINRNDDLRSLFYKENDMKN